MVSVMWKITVFENDEKSFDFTKTNKKFKKWLAMWERKMAEIHYDSSGDILLVIGDFDLQCYPIVGKYGI
jgi:hypothetical protein